MAVAVPIVSKKSVSMMVKMVRTAASRPRWLNTLLRSNAPSVLKLGTAEKSAGAFVTPAM